jgi:hypothetical protein
MSGNLAVPNIFGMVSTAPVSEIDQDFDAVEAYVNLRQITFDILSNRPAAGTAGAFYFATDTGQLYADTGSAWIALSASTGLIAASANTITGLTLSNDILLPNTSIDVAAGVCSSDEASPLARTTISLAALTSGTTSGLWVAGFGTGKLDAGAVAASTWYYVYLILNETTATTDILFSTSATSPALPSGYTRKRRIGAFKTDGSSHILAFIQHGNTFLWLATVLEINSNNPGTSAFFHAIASVPTTIVTQAKMLVGVTNTGSGGVSYLLCTPPSSNDETPSASNNTCAAGAESVAGQVSTGLVPVNIYTDSGGNVRVRLSFSDGSVTALMRVQGWIDARGAES